MPDHDRLQDGSADEAESALTGPHDFIQAADGDVARADRLVALVADRHAVEPDAVAAALSALVRGGGAMAQFSHPAFGGMAQWQAGGLSMAGAPFDDALKAKLDAVCTDLSAALTAGSIDPQALAETVLADQSEEASGDWWPAGFGKPSASGAQAGLRYAVFPAARRLAVWRAGAQETYDTGEAAISGVSQAENGDLRFSSAEGPVEFATLRRIPGGEAGATSAPETPGPEGPRHSPQDIAERIEQIGRLRLKGLLTEAEFSAKKAELLARL